MYRFNDGPVEVLNLDDHLKKVLNHRMKFRISYQNKGPGNFVATVSWATIYFITYTTREFLLNPSILHSALPRFLSSVSQIRGTLKSWTKLWCVLKPGVLLIYKTNKNGQWVGTVLLNACELIERPSKKDGFCFKLFHPLEQSIWAVKVGAATCACHDARICHRRASGVECHLFLFWVSSVCM